MSMDFDTFATPEGKTLRAVCVNKSYGKQQVLHALDLDLQPGCIYGLIGRNGAGKTTLLGILSGQNTMDSGSVTYGGEPVWENTAALADLCFSRELNGAAGDPRAALKVKDYLRAGAIFYPHWDAEYAQALIRRFGLEKDLKKTVNKLSKGQMSMVTITLALASRAPVTLLDEPVAGLDVVAREDFYRLLLDDYAQTNRTFVVSTHIIEEAAAVFERVIVLDEGRILENAPTEELVGQFRYLSGEESAVNEAVQRSGVQPVRSESLGRHKMLAVRGSAEQLAALAPLESALGVRTEPMNLQNVFVALCGHEDHENKG
jgi:ABC-2 type transport system ATP-binding protein